MGIYSRNEAFTVVFRPFLHCSHIASSGIGQTERSLRLGPSPSGCIALIPLLDQYFSNNGTTRREKRGSRPLDDDASAILAHHKRTWNCGGFDRSKVLSVCLAIWTARCFY